MATQRDDPPDPDAPRPSIVWDDRSHVTCADCRRRIFKTPGLVGRNAAGEALCFVCLEHACKPLGFGLRILTALHDGFNRWPGGPRRVEPVPWHWQTPGHFEPGPYGGESETPSPPGPLSHPPFTPTRERGSR